MRLAGRIAAGLGLAVVGVGVGLPAVLVHQSWRGLAVGVLAATAVLVLLPRGWWSRLAFVAGWSAAVLLAVVARPEGDYLVPANTRGYLLLGATLALVIGALVTLSAPPPRRADQGDPPVRT